MSRRNVDPSWLRRRASNKFCGDEEMCQPAPFSTCPRVPARPAPRRSRTWSTDLHRWIASIEEGNAKVDGLQISALIAAVVQELDQEVRRSRGSEAGLHFVEVMSCPGGCIGGGGQPYDTDAEAVKERLERLYEVDRRSRHRRSHENADVQTLYEDLLGRPLGEVSHRLLHRTYTDRSAKAATV